MHHLFAALTSGIVAVALVAAACGGGDDEAAQAQAAEQQASDAAAAEAAAEAAAAADAAAAAAREQAQTEQPADQATAEEQAEPEEQAAPEEQAQAEEEEEPASTLPADQLAYGDSLRGSVLSVEEPAQFRFQGTEADLVRIRVDGLDGMDPIITLLEPNRTEVASNDDESVANRDSLLIASLPSSGLQVIRVTPFNNDFGGAFIVSVELLEPEGVDDSTIMSIGDTIEARLSSPSDLDTFEFAGDAGQIVRIRADGDVGVDTYIEVFGPSGTFIGQNDDSGHGLDAEFELELSESGNYRVDVFPSPVGRPSGERHKIGDYRFSVHVLTTPLAAGGQTATALAGLALTYLDAVQQSDALTVFGLSGPEQIDQTGWLNANDVSRDLSRQQDIVTTGTPGDLTTEIEGDRARVRLEIGVPGTGSIEILRFDVVNVNGQWLVDFIERFAAPTEDETAAATDS